MATYSPAESEMQRLRIRYWCSMIPAITLLAMCLVMQLYILAVFMGFVMLIIIIMNAWQECKYKMNKYTEQRAEVIEPNQFSSVPPPVPPASVQSHQQTSSAQAYEAPHSSSGRSPRSSEQTFSWASLISSRMSSLNPESSYLASQTTNPSSLAPPPPSRRVPLYELDVLTLPTLSSSRPPTTPTFHSQPPSYFDISDVTDPPARPDVTSTLQGQIDIPIPPTRHPDFTSPPQYISASDDDGLPSYEAAIATRPRIS